MEIKKIVKKKLEDNRIDFTTNSNGAIIIDGLRQRLALIHFYFREEPTSLDRIALLWSRLEFVLEFQGIFKREIIRRSRDNH